MITWQSGNDRLKLFPNGFEIGSGTIGIFCQFFLKSSRRVQIKHDGNIMIKQGNYIATQLRKLFYPDRLYRLIVSHLVPIGMRTKSIPSACKPAHILIID